MLFHHFGLSDVVREVRVANRPVDPFCIRGPMGKLTADGGQFAGRKLRIFRFSDGNIGHFTASFWHRNHIDFVVDLHQCLVAFGCHGDQFGL